MVGCFRSVIGSPFFLFSRFSQGGFVLVVGEGWRFSTKKHIQKHHRNKRVCVFFPTLVRHQTTKSQAFLFKQRTD